MAVAVGDTYDATIADTNNLHRRVIIICLFAIVASTVFGWVLAAFAVRPFKQLARQTSQIDAGDEPPNIEVRGATEAVEIADAVKGMLERIWEEQGRTKAALASARDFSAVSAHELRTPLTAMRTNLEVLSTLDLPEEQRKEVVNDVIRTQSRIEATLGALERLAQGELSTSDDHVPVDITELLDRAAHDAMRVYPDLDVSLVPAPTVIIVGLPAGLRLAVDNAIANAVKHGGATRVQLSAVSSRAGVEIAIDDDGVGIPEEERKVVFDRFSRGSTASHSGSGLGLALVAQQAELHGGTASWRTARWAARGWCCGCRDPASCYCSSRCNLPREVLVVSSADVSVNFGAADSGTSLLTLRIVRASVSTRPSANATAINHQLRSCITLLPIRGRQEDPRALPLRLSA